MDQAWLLHEAIVWHYRLTLSIEEYKTRHTPQQQACDYLMLLAEFEKANVKVLQEEKHKRNGSSLKFRMVMWEKGLLYYNVTDTWKKNS